MGSRSNFRYVKNCKTVDIYDEIACDNKSHPGETLVIFSESCVTIS
jgi:hypothetical protein